VSRTYDALLTNDHLEWKGSSPEAPKPVAVKVEVPDARDERAAVQGSVDYDFSSLTPAERLALAERLWTSVDADDVDWALTPGQMAELEHRLAVHDRDPDAGETWESIREEIVSEWASRKSSAA
jgi:putative addiction module component (TIGR02574 family)